MKFILEIGEKPDEEELSLALSTHANGQMLLVVLYWLDEYDVNWSVEQFLRALERAGVA